MPTKIRVGRPWIWAGRQGHRHGQERRLGQGRQRGKAVNVQEVGWRAMWRGTRATNVLRGDGGRRVEAGVWWVRGGQAAALLTPLPPPRMEHSRPPGPPTPHPHTTPPACLQLRGNVWVVVGVDFEDAHRLAHLLRHLLQSGGAAAAAARAPGEPALLLQVGTASQPAPAATPLQLRACHVQAAPPPRRRSGRKTAVSAACPCQLCPAPTCSSSFASSTQGPHLRRGSRQKRGAGCGCMGVVGGRRATAVLSTQQGHGAAAPTMSRRSR